MDYLLLFLSAFSSATVLPGNSEVVFAVLLSKGQPVFPLIVAASFGNWLGGMTSAFLGRFGKWRWLERMGISQAKVGRIHVFVERWGAWTGLLGWAPVIGDVLMVALGFLRVSLWKISLFSALGRLLRYSLLALLILQAR